jgi:ubiquinone/menaquinone biosynthesis C-methylase UbiE
MRLNLGCGKDVREGWENVDALSLAEGVTVWDLREAWPWPDNSVEEAYCSHFLEHLTNPERCHFWNELYRVLAPGAKAQIIVPHWSSHRAYGDPTHQWPPVSEMAFFYLSKEWRDSQAPHTNELLKCDFEATWSYGLNQQLSVRNQEWQQFAVNWYKEAVTDIFATVTKK